MVNENREELDDFLEAETADPVRGSRRGKTDSDGNLPTFVTVMSIIDLIFCGLRLPLLIVSVLGILAMLSDPQMQSPQMQSMVGLTVLSFVAESLIAVCGLAAGIGMLTKKPWATIPGWVAVICCVISIGSNIYTTQRTIDLRFAQIQGPGADAARMGATVGLAGTVLFRLALLGCYIAALKVFTNWIGKNRPEEA